MAVEVYSRRPRIFRSPLQPPLRALLLAHHLPLLQWQRRKLLPKDHRQSRVEQDHKGLCRPRGPTPPSAITQGAIRVIIASPVGRRPDRTDNDNGYNAPFLSMNLALRLCEPEGLAAAGLENFLAEPVRGRSCRDGENPVRVGYGSPAGPQNGLQTLGSLTRFGLLSRWRPDGPPCRK